MGINIFGRLSSSKCDRVCTTNTNINYFKYKIEKFRKINNLLVVQIKYDDCSNYEGRKILVFVNMSIRELKKLTLIDPHFSSEHPEMSPIARFVPSKEGWKTALHFARTYV